MKRVYYLVALAAAAIALVFFVAKTNQSSKESTYGEAVVLSNGKGKAYNYLIEIEYKVPDTIQVQYDTIQGVPGPHPAYVVVGTTKYHKDVYNWAGKPTEKLDSFILSRIAPSGSFYRRISIRKL